MTIQARQAPLVSALEATDQDASDRYLALLSSSGNEALEDAQPFRSVSAKQLK